MRRLVRNLAPYWGAFGFLLFVGLLPAWVDTFADVLYPFAIALLLVLPAVVMMPRKTRRRWAWTVLTYLEGQEKALRAWRREAWGPQVVDKKAPQLTLVTSKQPVHDNGEPKEQPTLRVA